MSKNFFIRRSPKIFDKSSIGCALSSVHDEIEKKSPSSRQNLYAVLTFKINFKVMFPLCLFWNLLRQKLRYRRYSSIYFLTHLRISRPNRILPIVLLKAAPKTFWKFEQLRKVQENTSFLIRLHTSSSDR